MIFAIMGIAATKVLPEGRNAKVFSLPNRIFYAVSLSMACVGLLRLFLNAADVLIWEYWW